MTQLQNRMKNMPIKINHRKSKRKKGKPNCLREVVQNLYGIDGMDIRFPWKIRCNKFISFVQSIPGLIAQFNDNISDYQISIDQRMNILPFFAAIQSLPLAPNISYFLSNHIRKNKKHKFMKQSVSIYKQSFEICKILQNIQFSLNNTNILSKLFLKNSQTSQSMTLLSILRQIQSQNTNNSNINITALQIKLFLQSQKCGLNDLNLLFYQKKQNTKSKPQSLNNIKWNEIPEIIHPKWLLNRSKKSVQNAMKSYEWKQFQIETIYQILHSLLSDSKPLKIIDFGSGAGNVGLCIAYLFPKHTIICVECERSRIELAKERAKRAGITNMEFVCEWIQNINIAFDVGIGVHLCGIATDYAQIQCFKHCASFILCSCCNGKCCNQLLRFEKNKVSMSKCVQFPRSNYFRNAMRSYGNNVFEIFAKLTSFSDFNFDLDIFGDHKLYSIKYKDYCAYNIQRKFCKILCEIDRCLAALEIKENGYNSAYLTQIVPNNLIFESSPKSDVIVAVHSRF